MVQRALAAHLAVCLRGFEPSPRGEPAFRHGAPAGAGLRAVSASAPLSASAEASRLHGFG